MKSKISSALFVAALALPAFAAKSNLPKGAVFTERNLTPDQGLVAVSLDPSQVVLPGMEARPCHGQEFTDAWAMCQTVIAIRGGRMTLMDCSVRAGHVQATCARVDEPGNPILW